MVNKNILSLSHFNIKFSKISKHDIILSEYFEKYGRLLVYILHSLRNCKPTGTYHNCYAEKTQIFSTSYLKIARKDAH